MLSRNPSSAWSTDAARSMPLVCLRLMMNSAERTLLAQTRTLAPLRIESANILSCELRIPALGVQPGGNGIPEIGAKSMLPKSLAPGSSTDVPGVGYR